MGDGRPLALPTREVGRVLFAVRREAEPLQVGFDVLAGFGGGVLALGGHQQVVEQRAVVEQRVALLHEAHHAGRHGLLGLAHFHGAGAGGDEARHDAAQHRLADARAAVEAHDLALVHAGPRHVEDLGVDVAQNGLAVKGDGDAIQGEDGVFVGVGMSSHGSS